MLEYKFLRLNDVKGRKSEDGLIGFFEGRAAVYGVVDDGGDMVMPGAFTESLAKSGGEVLVLNHHAMTDPIGTASLEDRDDALYVKEGRLVLDLPSAKDVHVRLLNKLVTGMSIGYETVDALVVQNVRQLRKLILHEVSPVTFPMNKFARVTDVKTALEAFTRDLSEGKAGRALSSANRKVVSDCASAMETALASLRGLLSRPAEDDKSAAADEQKEQFAAFAAQLGGLRSLITKRT